MAVLKWGSPENKMYETGVSHGVLFTKSSSGVYEKGVPWDGLITVTEKPSGAETSSKYADNTKYLTLTSIEEMSATIEAFMYPDEFAKCDGSASIATGVVVGQQERVPFALSYRTILGNEERKNDYGYKLHILYNGIAAPSERAYATVNDSPDAITFSWEVTTTPVAIKGHKPASLVTINSTKIPKEKLKLIEDALYGTESTESKLLLPDEIIALVGATVG